jgi:hypothetical protein
MNVVALRFFVVGAREGALRGHHSSWSMGQGL